MRVDRAAPTVTTALASIKEPVKVRPFSEFNSFIFIILNMESVKKNQVRGCNSATVCTFTHDNNDDISDEDNDEVFN